MNNTTTDVPIIVRAFDEAMTETSTVDYSTGGWTTPSGGAAACAVPDCSAIPRYLVTAPAKSKAEASEAAFFCVDHTPDAAWTLMAARGELWGYGEDE